MRRSPPKAPRDQSDPSRPAPTPAVDGVGNRFECFTEAEGWVAHRTPIMDPKLVPDCVNAALSISMVMVEVGTSWAACM